MTDLRIAWRSPRAVATALLVLGGAAIYLVSYPGSMEFDSFVQLLEGRSRSYSNWHPPVMSWLLGVFDGLPGPVAAWFTGMDIVLAVAALVAVLWLPRRVSWWAVGAVAVMLPLPQLALSQAVVWKDTLFANVVVAGFVVLAYAAAYWPRRHLRRGLVAAAAVLFALAILTRQNGIIVLPCACAALAIVAARHYGWRRGLAYGAALAVSACAMAWAGHALLQLRADDYPGRQEQIKVLQLYDITGMLRRHPGLPLTGLDREAPALAKLIRTDSVRRWTPVKNDTLLTPAMVDVLEATPAPAMTRQWRRLIVQHPGAYLAVRADVFRWVLAAPDVGLCHPIHVGDEGDPEDLKALGVKPRLTARDMALKNYGERFEPTPVFSHVFYALLGLGVLVLLLRRRTGPDIVLAGLLAAAYVFTATFVIISIACDYRYLYLVDLSALTGLLYVAADWRSLMPPWQTTRGP